MHWLARIYARRIVNVNVNIVLAGLLALPLVLVVILIAQSMGLAGDHTLSIGPVSFYTVSVITLVSDVIADFSVYMALHWLANHGSWRHKLLGPAEKLVEPAHRGMSFVRDAGRVQIERAVLSPLLYGVWLGLQSVLIHQGVSAAGATAIGCVSGLVVVRTLHTFWMLSMERRAEAKRKTAAAAPPAENRV